MKKLIIRFRIWLRINLFSFRVFLSRIKWPTKRELKEAKIKLEDDHLNRVITAVMQGGAHVPGRRKRKASCEEDKVEQREPVLESDFVQFIQGEIE